MPYTDYTNLFNYAHVIVIYQIAKHFNFRFCIHMVYKLM